MTNTTQAQSLNISAEKLSQLKQLLPEIFTEDKVDVDRLKATLGEHIEVGSERYQLSWAGKTDAWRALQAPSTKTLVPCREESTNYDETKHVFIEGENLDVLKVLQKSYFGQVKMIYIDPPYNTGSDSFIYPDKFSETLRSYRERAGEVDEDGNLIQSDGMRKNSKENGHYHSNWLSMMYPRLALARNLLRDDGVIFVSIDDNEVHNLRLLMNEVFGEENFVGNITINGNPRGRDYGGVAKMHDYLMVYYKNFGVGELSNIPNPNKEFPFTDEKGGFELRELRNRNIAFNSQNRPNLYYPFYVTPDSEDENGLFTISLDESSNSIKVLPKKSQGLNTVWRWGKNRSLEFLNEEIKAKKMMDGGFQIVEKYRKSSRMARSIWLDKKVNTESGTLAIKKLFDGKVFSFPKPKGLIEFTLQMAAGDEKDPIILDFFAGSATTAHAVMDLNAEDGGERQYICVQLPEITDENSEAHKAGYATIAEIAKERIRRAAKQIQEKHPEYQGDLGFKVLKLQESNFKPWLQLDGDDYNPETLLEQMELHVDPLSEHATDEGMVLELMLKNACNINADVRFEAKGSSGAEGHGLYCIRERQTSEPMPDQTPHDGSPITAPDLVIVLATHSMTRELANQVIALAPAKTIVLDRCFDGDVNKTNIALQFKDAGLVLETI